MVGGDNDSVRSHGDDRIKVPRGKDVGEIADVIGDERMNEREVGSQGGFQQLFLPVHLDFAFVLFSEGAEAGWC
jgi:hypothetical protein